MATNRNMLVVGAPGYGKTTAQLVDLVAEAERGTTAMVVIDPHVESLAYGFLSQLIARGLHDRILYDRLKDLDRVLSWDFLSPSTATNSYERKGENDTRCRDFADVLLRRRGKDSMATTPGIEEWTLAALKLYMHQRKRRPLADLRYAFRFNHPTFQSLLEGCTSEDTRFKFDEIMNSGRTPFEAAERLIVGVCESPAFEVRTSQPPSFDLDAFLDAKGILIVEGGSGRSLSDDAMQTMMGAVILRVIDYVRARQREYPHVTLCLDEANNANLIGGAMHEIKAMAELRKFGFGVQILVQYLNFPSPSVTEGVLSLCATRRYFNCPDSRTAARLARDLGSGAGDSYEEEIKGLGVGECFMRQNQRTCRQRITPLSEPFGFRPLTQARTKAALAAIKNHPEYYSPIDGDKQPASESPTPLDQKTDNGPFGI